MNPRFANFERERRRQMPIPQRDPISLVSPDWPTELARMEREPWDGPALLDLPPRLQRYDRELRWTRKLRHAALFVGEVVLVLASFGAIIGGVIAVFLMAQRIW